MKKLGIIILVLTVIGVGFYWGYKNAILPKQQNQITKTPLPGSIIIYNPNSIPADAITRDTTLVMTLDTPVTLQDADGRNGTLKLLVKPKSITPNANTANKKAFLVDMELTSAPPNIRMVSPKVAVLDNASFTINSGGGSPVEGSNIKIEGIIKSIDENQVNATLKLSSW
jgi:hypothetical protein